MTTTTKTITKTMTHFGAKDFGFSGLRSAARSDLVVLGHRTEWGSRSFAVAGQKCWNKFPVRLRDLLVGPETFARHLKTHLFRAGFSD